jgi:hypothetical protein
MSRPFITISVQEAIPPVTQGGTPSYGQWTIARVSMPRREPPHTINFRNSAAARPENSLQLAATQTSSRPVPITFEEQFNQLADQWERETRNFSSPTQIVRNPAVRKIADLGPGVVRLILKRIQYRPWFWFTLLKELTNPPTDPVEPHMRGDMKKMSEAWVSWGERHGII